MAGSRGKEGVAVCGEPVDLVEELGLHPLRHFGKLVSVRAFLVLTVQCGESGCEVSDGSSCLVERVEMTAGTSKGGKGSGGLGLRWRWIDDWLISWEKGRTGITHVSCFLGPHDGRKGETYIYFF